MHPGGGAAACAVDGETTQMMNGGGRVIDVGASGLWYFGKISRGSAVKNAVPRQKVGCAQFGPARGDGMMG